MNTCPKPVEDCKVGPEDWLVLNFELSKDSGYVNYPNHQTTVNMRLYPTKVTRKISILELLLIQRLLMPIKAINDPKPIHQPTRIDLPVQKERVKE